MWKKALLGIVIILLGGVLLAWFNRFAILTHIVLNRAKAGHIDVAPYQPVTWQTGPEAAALPLSAAPSDCGAN